MEIRRCMKCMHELKPGETVCPKCGRSYGDWKTEPFALKPGTILEGKYLVGEMLGQGGFGITYIGFDLLLEQKVAIKEYFPMSTGMVSRENRSTVVWSSAMMEKTGVQKGFDSFLKEARKMAKLGGIPGVVGVKSVFIQNETAYIVMDFIEGETLLKKLEREGPMEFDTCVRLLTPIMQALAEVHRHGIIHRDISPDNIMVQKDGRLILLDLGAAKDLDIQGSDGSIQSSQMVAKHGFSPFEQYGRSGKIGPWTDVYAMAATIYYCCTGKLPPSAVDRIVDDTLVCQPLLTGAQFDALASCMAILAENRPQDMNAMLGIVAGNLEPKKAEMPKEESPKSRLTKAETPEPETPKPEPRNPKLDRFKWIPAKNLCVLAIAGIIVLCIVLAIDSGNKKQSGAAADLTETALRATPGEIDETTPAEATLEIDISRETHMMAAGESDPGSDRPFWGQNKYKREDVETVTFQGILDKVPSDAWDVSEAGDQSVLAWMDGSDLYVAADGKIALNSNASNLFASFSNLKEIDFGDCIDTSNVTGMNRMFYGCSSLISLDVSGFNTANVTNMRSMFYKCSSLTSLNVSGFNTANVTDMGNMFYDCSGLTSLDVSGFNTANVTDMRYMFYDCSGLTSLDVSSFNTENVTGMNRMFYGCSSLISLDVSGFNTANVTNMRSMFYKCSSLTSLNVSGFNTANVTDMRHMFYDCSGLTSLDVSGFDTENVTDMGYMFRGCSSLTSLDVSSFNTANVTDMRYMFCKCSSLTSLDVSGFDTANVTNMSSMFYMFYKCSSLTDFQCTDSRIRAAYQKR